MGLRTEFEIWNEEVSQIETNMLSMSSDSPVPKDEDVSAMSMFIDNLNKAEKAAQAVYIKLAVEITNYEDVNKTKKEAEYSRLHGKIFKAEQTCSSWKEKTTTVN